MVPSATVLGGSSALYTLHVRQLRTRYQASGLNDIVTTLQPALEEGRVDSETLGVIDDVLEYAANAQRGNEGEGVRVLWGVWAEVTTVLRLEASLELSGYRRLRLLPRPHLW